MQNFEVTYGECLSLILRDILLTMQEKEHKQYTAKTITVAIINARDLKLSNHDKKNLQKRVKNKLKRWAKGGLIIIDHRVTPKKTIENIYTPNF